MLAQLSALLRLEPGDVDVMLSFDEVVEALGRAASATSASSRSRSTTIVGTVDRRKEFDREFRPTSSRARARFEHIAEAARRGVSLPPIDVYRVGELHFVRDGHHRVAVARAQGRDTIDAHVVEVITQVAADTLDHARRPAAEEPRARCSTSASRCRPTRARGSR